MDHLMRPHHLALVEPHLLLMLEHNFMKKKILFTLALTILAALSPACGMIHDNFGRTGTTTLNIVVETPEKFSNLTWPIVSQIMVYIVGAPGTDYKVAVPITISPGSTSLRNLAPMESRAQVSLATTQAFPSLPIERGRNPCGSRTAMSELVVMMMRE